jgi:hypothetical protein
MGKATHKVDAWKPYASFKPAHLRLATMRRMLPRSSLDCDPSICALVTHPIQELNGPELWYRGTRPPISPMNSHNQPCLGHNLEAYQRRHPCLSCGKHQNICSVG